MSAVQNSIDAALKDIVDLLSELGQEKYPRPLTGARQGTQLDEEHSLREALEVARHDVIRILEEVQSRIKIWRSDLKADTQQIAKEHLDWLSQEAKDMACNLGAAQAHLDRIRSRGQLTMMQISRAVASMWRPLLNWLDVLRNWIKNISAQLWNIISSLMTPKEWKVGGKVGTGFLGLADVTLEITFGK